MAGETTTSTQVATGITAKHSSLSGHVVADTVSHSVTTAELQLNDVIQMVKVPKGATVLDVILVSTDIDTNGSPAVVLAVGDGDDNDYYVTGSTIGQAGGIVRSNALTAKPKTYTADDTIDVTVTTAAATAATGTISLTVLFTTN